MVRQRSGILVEASTHSLGRSSPRTAGRCSSIGTGGMSCDGWTGRRDQKTRTPHKPPPGSNWLLGGQDRAASKADERRSLPGPFFEVVPLTRDDRGADLSDAD